MQAGRQGCGLGRGANLARPASEPDPASDHFTPTVYLYDNFPGGVGLSEPLFRRQAELVQRAFELVAACDCRAGCPACVGPSLEVDELKGRSLRELAARVLDLLRAGESKRAVQANG